MGWSGGTFSRVHDWTDDESAGYNIESSRMDQEDDNLATGINACRHIGGQNTATANLPMGGYIHTGVGDGTASNHYAALGQVQGQSYRHATSGGTNTITLGLTPDVTAYAAGQCFTFVAGGTNTGSATLNVDGAGAKTIQIGGVNLIGGEIQSDETYMVVYDGTNFSLINYQDNYVYATKVSKASQNISDSSDTAVSWNASTFDYGDMWSAGDATKITVPVDGVYRVSAMINWDASAVGARIISLRTNGSTGPRDTEFSPDGSLSCFMNFSTHMTLSASDYLQIYAYQTSGGALAVSNQNSEFCVSLVRRT